MTTTDERRTLAGQRVLITGGGSGIGRGIALVLARDGATVAVAGRREAPLRATADEIARKGGRAHPVVLDVVDRVSTVAAVERVAALFDGGLDVLVNNAGVGGPNACGSGGPDRWDEVVRTNLDGMFHVTDAVVPYLVEGGRVVNVSSVLGKFGVPGYTAYCASKHGVIGFTKALALELAARRITVNAICPGWVETEMARSGMELLAEGMKVSYEEARQHALAQVPLGRIIDPSEVGELVRYLVSPAASAMTGQAISLCGGSTMG
jgi:NAD(P)-dependent dehydrogenase (short-subunit alcohol dehydrogenase family)